MTIVRGEACAKINLTLHVTGQRDDGYHLLDSLVVFASAADTLTATSGPDLSLKVTGPFAIGVPTDETNLVIRAAQTLQKARGVDKGAKLTLQKNLPHAAGIGSGSADAAATLAMLAELWGVAPLEADDPRVAALGADVPVCVRGPSPMHLSGIGDHLAASPRLPDCAILLVRPAASVPTPAVFKALTNKTGTAMAAIPDGLDYAGFVDWLKAHRNDLTAPACTIAPDIRQTLAALEKAPAVDFAGMSGSGATCFGIVQDLGTAQKAAQMLQIALSGAWVVAARMMQPVQAMRATT